MRLCPSGDQQCMSCAIARMGLSIMDDGNIASSRTLDCADNKRRPNVRKKIDDVSDPLRLNELRYRVPDAQSTMGQKSTNASLKGVYHPDRYRRIISTLQHLILPGDQHAGDVPLAS